MKRKIRQDILNYCYESTRYNDSAFCSYDYNGIKYLSQFFKSDDWSCLLCIKKNVASPDDTALVDSVLVRAVYTMLEKCGVSCTDLIGNTGIFASDNLV